MGPKMNNKKKAQAPPSTRAPVAEELETNLAGALSAADELAAMMAGGDFDDEDDEDDEFDDEDEEDEEDEDDWTPEQLAALMAGVSDGSDEDEEFDEDDEEDESVMNNDDKNDAAGNILDDDDDDDEIIPDGDDAITKRTGVAPGREGKNFRGAGGRGGFAPRGGRGSSANSELVDLAEKYGGGTSDPSRFESEFGIFRVAKQDRGGGMKGRGGVRYGAGGRGGPSDRGNANKLGGRGGGGRGDGNGSRGGGRGGGGRGDRGGRGGRGGSSRGGGGGGRGGARGAKGGGYKGY